MVMSKEREKILVVDDEDLIRRTITRKLAKEGYRCSEASSGDEALDHLKSNKADLVILDVKMPGKKGTEILLEIKADYPETAVVMATAINDPQTILTCMKHGAYDYIPKPFSLDDVVSAVGSALIKRRMEIEIKNHVDFMDNVRDDRSKEIRKQTLGSFEALVNALEAKDRFTAGHSRRVANIAVDIGQALGLKDNDIEDLRWGGLLHDVGKIAVDPNILNKPGKLTSEEYSHIMAHTQIGPNIVKQVANSAILEIISCHHYYFDGSGLEQKVAGPDIPLGARIMAMADAYDAITNERPYRSGAPPEAALAEIRRCSGTQFDPQVVEAFLRTKMG